MPKYKNSITIYSPSMFETFMTFFSSVEHKMGNSKCDSDSYAAIYSKSSEAIQFLFVRSHYSLKIFPSTKYR